VSTIVTAEKWIASTLKGDSVYMGASPGGVYRVQAPQSSVLPATVFQNQGGGSVSVSEVAGVRIMANALYLIKLIDAKNSIVALEAGANRMYTLLHRKSATVAGGLVLSSVQENEYVQFYEDGDQDFVELGHMFRLLLQ
jgi:hypothetical protein